MSASLHDWVSRVTTEAAAAPPASLLASLGALDDEDRLVLRLLEERGRGEASPWYHYIAMLPADVGAPS